jgi:hypothetical protein
VRLIQKRLFDGAQYYHILLFEKNLYENMLYRG